MPDILLIDDDAGLASPLREYLRGFGLTLDWAAHPGDGLDRIRRSPPDLVILDVMLPDMDGFEVCRRIRAESDVPVLMLTARGEVTDRVVGLELGADDYLAKPFDPRELVARVNSILKRARAAVQHPSLLRFERLEIDRERQQVWVQGAEAGLTTVEYRLLLMLAERPGRPFSRDEILNALKGVDADIYTCAVDILVRRMRHKLRPLDPIKTVRGAGYSFVAARP